MKKIDIKSIILGIIISGILTINIYGTNKIKEIKTSDMKVKINGVEVILKEPLISVIEEGTENAKLYMPVTDTLRLIGYDGYYNSDEGYVKIVTGGENSKIEMGIVNKYITTKSKEVDVAIINHTDGCNMYNNSRMHLEIYKDNRWEEIGIDPELLKGGNRIGSTAVGRVYSDKGVNITTFYFYKCDGKSEEGGMKAGKYRLVLEFKIDSETVKKEVIFNISE